MVNNTNNNTGIPTQPFKFISRFLKNNYLEEIEGDMEERFYDNVDRFGLKKARRMYRRDAIKLLRPDLMNSWSGERSLTHYGLLKHQLKIVWRQSLKQGAFSSIKLLGFAIGLAACTLIGLYVNHQTSYDQHYENGDQIFRVVNRWSDNRETEYWTSVQGPLKDLFDDNIPEMDQVARMVFWSWGDAGENHFQRDGSAHNYYDNGFVYADPEILDILEVPMVFGSRERALYAPNSVVISQKKAEQYFPGENPVGQRLILNNNPESTFVIGGVMADFPANSHLQADFILTLFERKNGPGTTDWCCSNYDMYVKINGQSDKVEVEQKMLDVRNDLVLDLLAEIGKTDLNDLMAHQVYYLQPVNNIYLNPEQVGDFLPHGSKDLAYIFGVIAITILLLACVNFINLSTAKSLKRSREVGLKKVVGSFRENLVFQYLLESCLYTLFAVGISLAIATVVLPSFNELAGTQIQIPWDTMWFIPGILGFSVVVGIVAGLYPAFYLTAIQPIQALKGADKKTDGKSFVRNGLIVFQFVASIVLIAGAIVTHQQFDFLMNQTLGYDKEQVVFIEGLETMEEEKKQSFKEELIKLSSISNATLSDFLPVQGSRVENRGYWISEKANLEDGFEAARWQVDENYLSTFNIKIIEGRGFEKERTDDESIIINKTMADRLAIDNPIGVELIDMFDEKRTIIGVVDDFYFESLFGQVRPLAMVKTSTASTLSVKINTSNFGPTIGSITNIWNSVNPDQDFRYSFLDQRFAQMYSILERARTIFLLFAGLSILIAALGLFALSIHLVEHRSKEISIRKVLGANVPGILLMLNKGFMKLLLIAIIIAIPIASVFADFILEDMANKITVSWFYFAAASAIVFFIALLTVSFESLKAARVNPVVGIRNE